MKRAEGADDEEDAERHSEGKVEPGAAFTLAQCSVGAAEEVEEEQEKDADVLKVRKIEENRRGSKQ